MLDDKLSAIYVITSLIAIMLLAFLLARRSPKNEAFCQCRPEGQMRCPSPMVLTHLYNDGKLTESSPLAKWVKEKAEKVGVQYKEVMPYEIWEMRQDGLDPYTG